MGEFVCVPAKINVRDKCRQSLYRIGPPTVAATRSFNVRGLLNDPGCKNSETSTSSVLEVVQSILSACTQAVLGYIRRKFNARFTNPGQQRLCVAEFGLFCRGKASPRSRSADEKICENCLCLTPDRPCCLASMMVEFFKCLAEWQKRFRLNLFEFLHVLRESSSGCSCRRFFGNLQIRDEYLEFVEVRKFGRACFLPQLAECLLVEPSLHLGEKFRVRVGERIRRTEIPADRTPVKLFAPFVQRPCGLCRCSLITAGEGIGVRFSFTRFTQEALDYGLLPFEFEKTSFRRGDGVLRRLALLVLSSQHAPHALFKAALVIAR